MTAAYEQRAAAYAGCRDAEMRLSARVSRLRLATFLPGAACLAWGLSDLSLGLLAAGAAFVLAFGVLVIWHARIDERAAWYDALHLVNRRAVARIKRAWDLLPETALPAPSDTSAAGAAGVHGAGTLERHPFGVDLDLFGRASLLQWLGPAATPAGTATLQQWLLRPATPAVIAERQQAVEALAPASDWREAMSAHGVLAARVGRVELDRFLAWAEGPRPYSQTRVRLLRVAVAVLALSIWSLMALHAAGIVEGLWLIPVAAGMVLSFATAARIHADFNLAGVGEHALGRYAQIFVHAAAVPGAPARLTAIRTELTEAPARMRQLNRIAGFAKLRSGAGIFHFVIQSLTLWDFHVFLALDRWRRLTGTHVRRWMEALGELDALCAFAQIRADNPGWCFPEVLPHGPESRLIARQLGHPLIPDARRVANDVEVGPQGTVLLITGSNMSGKSTLLRAIGLNVVLAQAGAPVCAGWLRMPPVDLETCLRVQDSLEQGLSYFMASLARLKGVVDRARHPPEGCTVLYLLDEILQGTNTVERGLAVRAVARHLLASGAIGVMTTHDLGLAGEEPLDKAARLAHFTETVDEQGRMSFDYTLRPGLATSRNALRLMQLIGLEVRG